MVTVDDSQQKKDLMMESRVYPTSSAQYECKKCETRVNDYNQAPQQDLKQFTVLCDYSDTFQKNS